MILGSKWRKTFIFLTFIAILSYFQVFDNLFNAEYESQALKHLTEMDQELLTLFKARDVSEPPNPGSFQL